jgi:hypothetical protein
MSALRASENGIMAWAAIELEPQKPRRGVTIIENATPEKLTP